MVLKVCGITRAVDARAAVEQGATAVGFVFWPRSPRYVAPEQAAEIIAALPAGVASVGVFVDEPVAGIVRTMGVTGASMVQLHGDEPAAYAAALAWPLVRSATLANAAETRARWPARVPLLLDAADHARRGGTGTTVEWTQAAGVALTSQVILAGGLTPENVAEAIAVVRPFGVDVSSGVESAPGVKDAAKVARFLEQARKAFAAHAER